MIDAQSDAVTAQDQGLAIIEFLAAVTTVLGIALAPIFRPFCPGKIVVATFE